MYIDIKLNVKAFMFLGALAGMGYLLYVKDEKIKSLTEENAKLKEGV